MGAGKTSVGHHLGKILSVDVIDTDEWIEQHEKKSIAAIFAENGEPYFRQLETVALKEVAKPNRIVTTGGGIIMEERNRQFMKEQGLVIFLDCSIEETKKRLQNDTTRPLLKEDKENKIATLYESRLPYYQEAHITVDTTGKTIEEIALEIVESIKTFT